MLTQAFADAVAEAERIITGAPHVTTEQDLAEGYDYLAGSIRASLQQAWSYERDFPFFTLSTGPYTKMGLDNPDTLYFHAYLRHDAEYVVEGVRGTTADLSFQVLNGDYTPVDVPDSVTAFDDRAIDVADDGTFELRLGPGEAAAQLRPPARGRVDARRARGLQRLDHRAPRRAPDPASRHRGRRAAAARAGTRSPSATASPARSCSAGCGRSSSSPSGSTTTCRSTRSPSRGRRPAGSRRSSPPPGTTTWTTTPRWWSRSRARTRRTRASSSAASGTSRSTTSTTRRASPPTRRAPTRTGMIRFVVSERDPGVVNWLERTGHTPRLSCRSAGSGCRAT